MELFSRGKQSFGNKCLGRRIQEQLTLYEIGCEIDPHWNSYLHGRKCIIRGLKCSNLNTLKNVGLVTFTPIGNQRFIWVDTVSKEWGFADFD